ncbi:MAG: RluA family pseudouridine synthase [Deltaproteobacteria bacterium]|nr:RluA family pseudouridine synthase [Deltaproteobacteria bacterium]
MPFSGQHISLNFEDAAPVRVDIWLALHLPDASRAKIQRLVERGKILVNGIAVKRSHLLRTGDSVEVVWEDEADSLVLKPSPLDLSILFEDEDLIVVDKPAGVSVHPGAGKRQTTLVEGILHKLGKEASKDLGFRPGLVHRLDKDTTGVMVYAKNESTQLKLAKQFASRQIKREYLALLDGYLKAARIIYESYLFRDPLHRQRFASLTAEAYEAKFGRPIEKAPSKFRRAVSTFTKKKTYGNRLTLASISLQTGRTHQIRVHSQDLKCPVLGDQLYNRYHEFPLHFAPELRKQVSNLPRQMLHAKSLGFRHPRTLEDMEFKAPLPKDLGELLNSLEPYRDVLWKAEEESS